MNAEKLYSKLERDFIKPEFTDDWAKHMQNIDGFLTDNFKKRSMGLVCDFTEQINEVYTAVFPSDKVLKELIKKDVRNALLFIHHPSVWDIRKRPVFTAINKKLLEEMKKRNVAIYNLHVPLDNYGEYSTSKTLADALRLTDLKPCSPYCGGLAGVIGNTKCKTISELRNIFEKAIGHKIKVYDYGNKKIENGKVVVVAGGGNEVEFLKEAFDEGIKVVVTGVSSNNDYSRRHHQYEEENEITVLGGTHYSTEMFACKAMCKYFKKLGLPSKFIEDKPIKEDM